MGQRAALREVKIITPRLNAHTHPCSRISNAGRSSLAGEADGELLIVRVTRPRVFKPTSLESTFFVFPLSSARAAFSVETLARGDERRCFKPPSTRIALRPTLVTINFTGVLEPV